MDVHQKFNTTHPSNAVLAAITGTIGAIGLPGNLFFVLLILSRYKKRKPHEWLLFFLALNDFLLCLNSAAFEGPFLVRHDRIECKIAAAGEYIFGTPSFLIPPMVAYNRYISLYVSYNYGKIFKTRNVVTMWLVIMLFSVAWNMPFILTDSLGQDDLGLCGIQVRSTFLAVVLLSVVPMFIVSYGVLLYFSWKVISKVRQHKKQAQRTHLFQSRLINESKELIVVMLIVSAVPLLGQVPGALVKVLQTFLDPFDPWISRGVVAAFPATSACNAYVTMYGIKSYRKEVKDMFRKIKMRNNTVSPGNNYETPV